MKVLCLLIILLCVQVGEGQYFKLFDDGTYDFNYHTSGGQHRSEVRYPDGTVLGKYAYITPLGHRIDVEYSAGKHGYKEKRKVSKVGIRKSPRLNIQTKPSFGFGRAPFSSNPQPQTLESSERKFPVFRPAFNDNEGSHSLKFENVNVQTVYHPMPTTQRPRNTNRYPSEDFEFNPTSEFRSLRTTTHKPDDLLWIPSVLNKPRMPLLPIWMKPTPQMFETTSTTTTTTEKPEPDNLSRALAILNSGIILRQPLRRPVPTAQPDTTSSTTSTTTSSTTSSTSPITTTTQKPFHATTDRSDDDSPCFKTISPIKNNSKVSVKPVGNSGVVNVKPLEPITNRMTREDGLQRDMNFPAQLRFRAVMAPKQNQRQQFLPSNGFSAFPPQFANQNDPNNQFDQLNTEGNVDPGQHVSSPILVVHDRPRSQPNPANLPSNGLVNGNFFNSKFQNSGSFRFREDIPNTPLDFVQFGVIQPRRD